MQKDAEVNETAVWGVELGLLYSAVADVFQWQ